MSFLKNAINTAGKVWDKVSTKEDPNALKDYIYIQCPNKEGFTEYQLSTSFDPIQDAIDMLRDRLPGFPGPSKTQNYFIDLSGQRIICRDARYHGDNPFMKFYINEFHVGTLFPSDPVANHLYEQIKHNKIQYMHLDIWFNSRNTGKATLWVME